jgi:signal transduction histidine kinase/ligand-binding sensor domain-containing protein
LNFISLYKSLSGVACSKGFALGIILLLELSANTGAQYENLKFNQYREQQGLSVDNVNCIIQDPEGFIWIGTDDGLNKFDGNTFTKYVHKPADSTSVIHNHILYFFISSDSVIWIGTQYGMCSYRRETDDFLQFTEEQGEDYIRGFYEDKNKRIHVVNDRGETSIVEGNHLKPEYQFNFHVYSFLRDTENNFWFGADEGLYFYNVETDTLELFKFASRKNPKKTDVAIFCLLEDDNKIWAGTRGEGVFIIDKLTGRVSPFEKRLDFIKALYKDDKGNILIGDTYGLKIFNKRTHKLMDYQPIQDDKQSLASNAVDAIFIDRQENLWLGVKFGGINLAFQDKGFHFIDYESKDPVILTKKAIISLAEVGNNKLWLGAYTNGLDYLNLNNKSVKYLPPGTGPGDLQRGSVYELYNENDSILWIGSYFGGLQAMNLKTGKIRTYNHDPQNPYSIAGNDVRSICKDVDGNLWIITHGTGLNKFDRKTNRFYHFKNEAGNPRTLVNDWAYHCICDSRGYIWIATPNGLSVTRDGSVFETYYHDAKDTSSLISNEVFTLFEDSHKDIWVGTRNGLSRYSFKTRNFMSFTQDDGLIDNSVCSILEDDHGNLWIATKKGLSKWNRKTGQFSNYDTGDGLQDNEFMENACLKTHSGHMYFGSVNIGTWFHPDSLTVNSRIPEVYLTDLKLFNKSIPIESHNNDAILRKHIRYTKEIVLDYTQKVISFEFAALNYIHPEKNSYAYKLENFDKDWNIISYKREATYTNLTPGKYTFRVKASNNDGFWNEEGVSLKITILPPFWKTWWFRLLTGLSILLLIVLVYYIRVQQIRTLNINLERTVESRTKELKSKNEILALQTRQLHELNAMKDKFISIIGHDLKNPMNVIKGFTEILTDEYDELSDESRKSYLFHISQTVNKTANLLENLFSWAQSQSGMLTIEPVYMDICQIVQSNCRLFKESAAKKKIRLLNQTKSKEIFVFADRNMIDTVLRNLISNAIKFTPSLGTITVDIDVIQDEDKAEISITDTGLGMHSSGIANLFRIDKSNTTTGTAGEIGTGFGLILCKEFVEKNGGSIDAQSTHGKGSVFRFTIPLAANKSKKTFLF